MDFVVGDFFFTANLVKSVKSLSGTYEKLTKNPRDNTLVASGGGTWQLTAIS